MTFSAVIPETGVARTTAVRRATLSAEDLSSWLSETYSRVYAFLADHGNHPTGAPFARYQRLGLGRYDVEAGFPVTTSVEPASDIQSSTLPSGLLATTTHSGRLEDIEDAYRAVASWIIDHGGERCGDPWEVYLSDPRTMTDPASWRTKILQPYRPRIPTESAISGRDAHPV